jgi:hypothetical protein
MGRLAGTAALVLALALSLRATPALADGGVLQATGVTTAVTVKGQRAVIWQKPDALELTIEPIFNWTGEGAWVIPLPALPEVSAGDPQFLAELDQATAPVFVQGCIDYECYCDIDKAPDASMGGGTLTDGRISTAATIWSSGTVGDFDYVVLSTTSGEGLVGWATANGFAISDASAAVLGQIEVEDSFFFVARVSPDTDPARALSPISFRFSPDVAPFYPMRFTGSVMPEGASIDVMLWLITSGARIQPGGVAMGRPGDLFEHHGCYVGSHSPSATEYDAQVTNWLSTKPKGGFVVEYDDGLWSSASLDGAACTESVYCVDVDRLQPVTPEMKALLDESEAGALYNVTRLRGQLRGEALATDLYFLPVNTWVDRFDGLYCSIQSCGGGCYCPDTDDDTHASHWDDVTEIRGQDASPSLDALAADDVVEPGGSSGCASPSAHDVASTPLALSVLAAFLLCSRGLRRAIASRSPAGDWRRPT